MVDFNINSLLNSGGNSTSSTNFNSLLNVAKGQLDNIVQQVRGLLTQLNLNSASVTTLDQGGAFQVSVPNLSNLVTNQTDVLIKTALPLDRVENFNLQIQNSNIVSSQGQPVLRLEGQILQDSVSVNNPQIQRFTADIPLSSLITNTGATAASTTLNNDDQIIRNFSSNQLQTFTNNLSENVRSVLPSNLQNLNLTSANNLNIQITSLITPSGEQLIEQNVLTQAGAQTNSPNPQAINGQIEIFTDANEALIRTEFGTFRTSSIANLPNGSNVTFTITGQAAASQNLDSDLLSLNPTNLQTLKVALESSESPLQNLLRLLNSSQAVTNIAQRFFPHPDDKTAYAKQLMFLSAASKGSPEGWLGDDGQLLINRLAESDGNFNRLQEIFGTLRNFSGQGQQQINPDWNSYVIPFYDGHRLSFVTIQVQRDPENNGQNFKGKRKFILELEQDDLGRVAIEGLYSNIQGKVNNMDVVLKTEKPVDEEFMKELSAIFNETALAYNFNGSLNFASFTTSSPVYTEISKILGDGIII